MGDDKRVGDVESVKRLKEEMNMGSNIFSKESQIGYANVLRTLADRIESGKKMIIDLEIESENADGPFRPKYPTGKNTWWFEIVNCTKDESVR